MSQPDNAGTVTSGDIAGQAWAGDEADSAARVDPGLDHDADGLADAADAAEDEAEDQPAEGDEEAVAALVRDGLLTADAALPD